MLICNRYWCWVRKPFHEYIQQKKKNFPRARSGYCGEGKLYSQVSVNVPLRKPIPPSPSFAETNQEMWPMWWLFVLKSNNQWKSQWNNKISASLPSGLSSAFQFWNCLWNSQASCPYYIPYHEFNQSFAQICWVSAEGRIAINTWETNSKQIDVILALKQWRDLVTWVIFLTTLLL